MGRDGANTGISQTRPTLPHPASFNFLNRIGMRIILNKRGGVGMGATRPEPTPLSFLLATIITTLVIHFTIFFKKTLKKIRYLRQFRKFI